jgi:hypothetical protein
MAECGNIDIIRGGYFKDRLAFEAFQFPAVYI